MPQDFSGQNLRGRSFRGRQDLTGADFSYADIRGADFSNAILRGTIFREAKAGLQKRWVIGQLILSLLLLGASGFLSVVAGFFVAYLLTPQVTDQFTQLPGILFLIFIAVILFVFDYKGFTEEAFGTAIIAVVLAIVVLVAGAIYGFVESTNAGFKAVTIFSNAAGGGSGAVFVALAGSVLVAIAGTVGGVGGSFVAFAIDVTVAIVTIGVRFEWDFNFTAIKTVIVVIASAVVFSSSFIALRALVGDEKFTLVRTIAFYFTIGGTSFRGADLTDADFTEAKLKNTDFRGAILIGTCWYKTKMLNRVRPGVTYLRNTQLQIVLITGQGQGKNFDRQDLRGINLQGAKLADASFIGADLSEANLQNADLSRAKLVQTQLDETDLTGATLTGAYIEDWGITSHTKLDEVRCEYVFMRLPTKEDPNPRRKPDNWEEKFEDGDFADFIKPIFDTLDLYHNQGVDPRAIAISFKQLAENHPEADLEIVAMEKRGSDKFLLRAKTAPDADRSSLSAEYFSTYNQLKALAEQESQKLLVEKDNRIRSLENMVVTALQRSSFYSETNIEKVETMSHNPGGISQNVSGGQVYGGMQAAQGDNNQQTQETNVAASNEKQLTQQEVIQMLARIEELVRGNPELPEADKEKSLKYLGAALAEVREPEPDKQLVAGSVKRMSETLKTASETVASSKSLWENVKPILIQIPGWLGVAKSFFGF